MRTVEQLRCQTTRKISGIRRCSRDAFYRVRYNQSGVPYETLACDSPAHLKNSLDNVFGLDEVNLVQVEPL